MDPPLDQRRLNNAHGHVVLSTMRHQSLLHAPLIMNDASQIDYLDGNDWTWKVINLPPAQNFGGTTLKAFFDVQRRIWCDRKWLAWRLRALNLSNIAAGWTP